MMKTRLKGQGCLTIRNCLRRETSTESLVGSKTSTSSSQRTITSSIPLTENSSTDQRTTTISSTTLHSLTQSSSARTLHQALSQDSQTIKCQKLAVSKTAPSNHTSAVVPCTRHSPSSEDRSTQHHSFLNRTRPTSIELYRMLKRQ